MLRALGAVGSVACCTAAGAVVGFCSGGIYGAFYSTSLAEGLGCLYGGALIGAVVALSLGLALLARFGKRLRLARVSAAVIVLGAAAAGVAVLFERFHGW